jgi:ketosteroid isomerase-like protein
MTPRYSGRGDPRPAGFGHGSALCPDPARTSTDAVSHLPHKRAARRGDAWYREHLADDFVCTRADGRRIGKDKFLRLTAEGPGVTDVSYDEVDVRPLGDVALVHGVTHYVRDGSPMSTRYTDVWRFHDGDWQTVAAQLTRVASPSEV